MRLADFLIPLSLLVGAACTAGSASDATPPSRRGAGGASPAIPVTVAPVVRKPMPVEIRVIGTAEADATVAVRAQITGAVTSVHFTEGDDVIEGQVLFTLDRRPLEATLQQVQANLTRDLAQAANATAQAGRYQTLNARGLVSGQEAQTMAATAAALEATVGADRAAVENATVQLEYATIVAPIAGRTGALLTHAGNLVRANDTTPLVIINKVTPINVVFGIPETQMHDFKRYLAQRSLHVEARAPGDTGPASTGRISFVDNAVDPTTGTINIKGTFPNQDRRLWPGQFVNVVVTLASDPDALVVPAAAVQAGQQGSFVYLVQADQTVDLRPVVVARTLDDQSVIRSGLTAGDTVVTDGQLRLVAGSRISVKADPAPQKPDTAQVGTP